MSIRRVSFASCAIALVLGCSGSSGSDVAVGGDPGSNNNGNPSNKVDGGKAGGGADSGVPLGGSDGGSVDPGTDGGVVDPSTDAGIGGGKVDAGGGPVVTGFPQPSGACPAFTAGDVTFHPQGGDRKVAITLGDPSKKGPLVFYWYATTSSPAEAQYGLPITAVKAAGSIVVAPYDVANAGQFPWLSNVAQHEALFDEVLGCAVQNNLIDTKHIHTIGFSAGALMTTQLSYDRSKYLASVATYSGGGPGTFQDPNNKFAAMIMTGGANDQVVQDFFKSSTDWQATLKGAGHFAMLCNHGGGHSIPQKLVPGVWQFFLDHPFGTNPSPYAGHIPSTIAPPCVE